MSSSSATRRAFRLAVTGRTGVMSHSSVASADSAAVPIARAMAMMSSLSLPINGRRTGRSATASIALKLASVCDDTCPIDSPVTNASTATRARLRAAPDLATVRAYVSMPSATASPPRTMTRFNATCQ